MQYFSTTDRDDANTGRHCRRQNQPVLTLQEILMIRIVQDLEGQSRRYGLSGWVIEKRVPAIELG